MAANITYRCLNCGGDLAWNAQLQTWKCEYCDQSFTLDQLDAAGKAEISQDTVQRETEIEDTVESTDGTAGDMVSYTCNHCGAEIVTDKTTSATFCVYCGNPVVISEKLIGLFKPEKVIPFKTTKQQAVDAFKQYIKKPLTPRPFYTTGNLDKITGVYIPFWLYDGTAESELVATGTKVTTWSDRRNRYTKTDTYNFYRSGALDFHSIPVDCSSKTDDATMDSIEPFQFSEMVDFSPAYLAGYLAEKYDITDDAGEQRACGRAANTTIGALLQTVKGFTAVSVLNSDDRFAVEQRRYVLLPVWLLNTKYKGKNYLFAMNGQTGKLIGNTPIDVGRALLYGIATFAVSCVGIAGLLTAFNF